MSELNGWVAYFGDDLEGAPSHDYFNNFLHPQSEESGPYFIATLTGQNTYAPLRVNESWVLLSEEGGMYHGRPYYEPTIQMLYSPTNTIVWDGGIPPWLDWPFAWSGRTADKPLPVSACVRHF